MARFFALVKNEYIKTFKRVSTIAMLVLTVVAALGVGAISLLEKASYTEAEEYMYSADYSEEINWLKKTKPEGYENNLTMYEYLSEYETADYNYYQVAYDLSSVLDGDELRAAYEKLFVQGDWQSAYEILANTDVETISLSEGAKWAYSYRYEHNIPWGYTSKDSQILTVRDSLDSSESTQASSENAKEIILAEYLLDNDIEFNTADSMSFDTVGYASDINFWTVFNTSASVVQFIGLLVIVIAGLSVASEYHQGTIKFLLINPVKRWKILMSKYFTVLTIGLMMILLMYIVMIPVAGLCVGFDNIGASYYWVDGDTVKSMPGLLKTLQIYMLNSVSVLVMGTLAFAISSLFKSSAFAIGLSVFCMLGGSTITSLLSQLNLDWGRYLIFSNTSLQTIIDGTPSFAHQTLGSALIVIIAHMAVFILTAWDGFTKREV